MRNEIKGVRGWKLYSKRLSLIFVRSFAAPERYMKMNYQTTILLHDLMSWGHCNIWNVTQIHLHLTHIVLGKCPTFQICFFKQDEFCIDSIKIAVFHLSHLTASHNHMSVGLDAKHSSHYLNQSWHPSTDVCYTMNELNFTYFTYSYYLFPLFWNYLFKLLFVMQNY